MRRLESAGVISGYGAQVVPARLAYGIQAFIRYLRGYFALQGGEEADS